MTGFVVYMWCVLAKLIYFYDAGFPGDMDESPLCFFMMHVSAHPQFSHCLSAQHIYHVRVLSWDSSYTLSLQEWMKTLSCIRGQNWIYFQTRHGKDLIWCLHYAGGCWKLRKAGIENCQSWKQFHLCLLNQFSAVTKDLFQGTIYRDRLSTQGTIP